MQKLSVNEKFDQVSYFGNIIFFQFYKMINFNISTENTRGNWSIKDRTKSYQI